MSGKEGGERMGWGMECGEVSTSKFQLLNMDIVSSLWKSRVREVDW